MPLVSSRFIMIRSSTIAVLTFFLFQVECRKIASGIQDCEAVTVCYVSTWAVYRPDKGKFTIDDIDPALCTHLIYAFAGLNESTSSIKSLDPFNDLEDNYGKGNYVKMTSLKNRFPHLKVTLAIGGWNEGSEKYSALAASPNKRNIFVDSVVKFLKKFNFDGLDLDWEYPGARGGSHEDKENFVSLVQELREEMDKNGWILTAAFGAGKGTIDTAYNLPVLSNVFDYIHLMCYDYHGSWDGKVGANAPLSSDNVNDNQSVKFSVKYLIENGVSPKKLVLGVPFYGRTFVLKNPESNNNETEGKGFQGPYTREDGFLGYNEICSELNENKLSWHQWWDEETKTVYAQNKEKVISFDNAESLKQKVKLAVYNGLAGVMVWSMDTDDFHGNCEEETAGSTSAKYPLLRVINHALNEYTREIEINSKKNKKDGIEPNGASKQQFSLVILVLTLIIIANFKYSCKIIQL